VARLLGVRPRWEAVAMIARALFHESSDEIEDAVAGDDGGESGVGGFLPTSGLTETVLR
jgi:hypothetical protein